MTRTIANEPVPPAVRLEGAPLHEVATLVMPSPGILRLRVYGAQPVPGRAERPGIKATRRAGARVQARPPGVRGC
jgi:hypothetical protein